MRELWIILTLTLVSGLSAHPDDLKSVLEDIVKRLDEKDARIRQLEVNSEEQKATIVELSKIVDQYKNTVDSQQERITTLEEELTIQKIMIEELQGKETFDTEIPEKGANTTVNALSGTTERSTGKLAPRSRIQRRESENPVAFFASLTDHAENLGDTQNIAFDRVLTNIGDAYNNHAGVFIAPVSGIYVFSTTIMSFRNTNSHFGIYRNGSLVTRMFYHGEGIQAYDTTSNTITIQLSKGDDISVTNVDPDTDIHGGHYCTFTGFLLQEIYDGTTVVGK